MTDTTWLDATEQARMVRDGEVAPLELVEAAIGRIEALNPTLNAVIHERFDAAREEADGGRLPNGPLRGVPFLMKDLLQTVEGELHTMGWKVLKDLGYRAPLTSFVAQKLIDSGLIRLGQTTVPEWGTTLSAETSAWGVTRNPWNTGRAAGGSSTGSAVAVASGMVPIAHGNDAGGSIRIPSAFCGVVGLKGTRGRSSLGPLHGEYLNGSTEEGVLARSVRDVALGMDVLSGTMPGDPFPPAPPTRPYTREVGADPGRLRIGFLTTTAPDLAEFSEDAITAVRNALSLLTDLGHTVVDSHPVFFDAEGLTQPFVNIVACQEAAGAASMQGVLGRDLGPDDFEPWTWALIERGRATPAVDYMSYNEWRNGVSRGAGQWWAQGHDLLVLPTVARTAPAIGALALETGDTFESVVRRYFSYVPHTHLINATGQPAISLPLHMAEDGMPLGVMIVAAQGREDLLLRIAAQLEAAAPWAGRHPTLAPAR